MVTSASNMTSLNAITATNANNAINESIASNSQVNIVSSTQQNNLSDLPNNVCSGFHESRSYANRDNVRDNSFNGNILPSQNTVNQRDVYNASSVPFMPSSLPSTPLGSTVVAGVAPLVAVVGGGAGLVVDAWTSVSGELSVVLVETGAGGSAEAAGFSWESVLGTD
jgi:hypothetical protein